mmetsp:Transcript_27392/g.24271  ORF Transcript_27392/g.24271 Transcript_27392/m.24271 type:complete len:84 (+) Transcript_27392:899-1150(+)
MLKIKIVLDNKYTLTERKVYTAYDMLGQVGGFMGIIISGGGIFAAFFSGNMYLMTLLSNFYKVDENANTKKAKILPKIINSPT